MAFEEEEKEPAPSSIEIGGIPPSEQGGRPEKRLARGLEDVSNFFLSQRGESAPAREKGPESPLELVHHEPAQPVTAIALSSCAAMNREQVISLLHGSAAVLEEGMRVIDSNIPCELYGPIDLLAVDGTSQLTIIDVDVAANDGMLLRAICQFDWFLHNVPIVRRMYRGHVINFSSDPRIFLVAPQFPPTMTCASHRITAPRINCFRYHSVAVPGGAGIFFEPI
jgi:hypothetical protein